MRPAQKAPENEFPVADGVRRSPRFNEAGAKSAGKHYEPGNCRWNRTSGFNEAGAKSAGKHEKVVINQVLQSMASMRPAQKAPENPRSCRLIGIISICFNEAGAKSAGKLLLH